MPLERALVDHIAELARLGLTDEERERFAEQLGDILDAASRLQQVDTSNVPVTATIGGLENIMRDDVVVPSLDCESVLANAPRASAGQFRVPAVLD